MVLCLRGEALHSSLLFTTAHYGLVLCLRGEALRCSLLLTTGLGTLSPFVRRFEFALQKGLENTFLSASDTLLREPITKLAFPPGALLAGLAQRRQGSDGKRRQLRTESFDRGPLEWQEIADRS